MIRAWSQGVASEAHNLVLERKMLDWNFNPFAKVNTLGNFTGKKKGVTELNLT
jgi:hypothetical protein